MNTDIIGIRRSLAPFSGSLRDRPAVIIGAGGTARSAVAALAADVPPSHVAFLVRDPARAASHVKLSGHLLGRPSRAIAMTDPTALRILADAALIIQTTPVGMGTDAGRSPLPFPHRFAAAQTIFDVIYRPLETAFMTAARRDGATVIGGLELFLQQGAAAFETWTGHPMPLEAVRPAVLSALAV